MFYSEVNLRSFPGNFVSPIASNLSPNDTLEKSPAEIAPNLLLRSQPKVSATDFFFSKAKLMASVLSMDDREKQSSKGVKSAIIFSKLKKLFSMASK